jgi:hypothetical protein
MVKASVPPTQATPITIQVMWAAPLLADSAAGDELDRV